MHVKKCVAAICDVLRELRSGLFSGATFAPFSATKCVRAKKKGVTTLSDAMPGWQAWELRPHNGGVRCPDRQERHRAAPPGASRSAGVFLSVRYSAFMFWRALQGLAIAHSCCGAEPWLSTPQTILRYSIDIVLLAIRTTCLRRLPGILLQSVYAGKANSPYM